MRIGKNRMTDAYGRTGLVDRVDPAGSPAARKERAEVCMTLRLLRQRKILDLSDVSDCLDSVRGSQPS